IAGRPARGCLWVAWMLCGVGGAFAGWRCASIVGTARWFGSLIEASGLGLVHFYCVLMTKNRVRTGFHGVKGAFDARSSRPLTHLWFFSELKNGGMWFALSHIP